MKYREEFQMIEERIRDNMVELRKAIGQVLTVQYDYPPNGMGSMGYKGFNLYRFKVDDLPEIQLDIAEKVDSYMHSYNIEMLAQEIITDLLDEGLISYGGYGFKEQMKERTSI